jgi:hypothetical protein
MAHCGSLFNQAWGKPLVKGRLVPSLFPKRKFFAGAPRITAKALLLNKSVTIISWVAFLAKACFSFFILTIGSKCDLFD